MTVSADTQGSPVPRDSRADVARLLAQALDEEKELRVGEAGQLYERALRADPDHAGALCAYARFTIKIGQPQPAVGLARRAIELQPARAQAHHYLGLAYRNCGRLADAIASLRRAAALQPDDAGIHLDLSSALLDAADPLGARPHLERALALDPDSAAIYNNFGIMYRQLDRPEDAIAAYRRACELDPRQSQAQNNLGNLLRQTGDLEGAIAAFRKSIALAPNHSDTWGNLLLALGSSDRRSARDIAAEHFAYGEHFSRLIRPMPSVPIEPMQGRRLRIGYVSSDLRQHAVANFIWPLLAAHDRSRFEIFCYYNLAVADKTTERIRDEVEHFTPIWGTPDRRLADLIRQDRIDILVDVNGHTAHNRLPLFFLKPAPIQVTWLGYLGTTGVPSIDYRLTDSHADPPGLTDALHSEALWRLPRTLWCYQPLPDSPDVGPPPLAANGFVTFACLNNPAKISPTVLDLWSEIMRAVPGSRLMLLTAAHVDRRAEVEAFFARSGIAESRIEQVGRRPIGEYLARYNRADIALDTWPIAGGTTTCDALWMGAPVVTLAGDRSFARSGASILANVGLGDLVAEAPREYVSKAAALVRDGERLATIRAGLRARMGASALTDAKQFARDVEAAYTAMCVRLANAAGAAR